MALSMLSLSKLVKSYRIWKLVSCQFARHLGHPFSKPNRGASLPPKAASGPAAAEATQRRAAPFCRRHLRCLSAGMCFLALLTQSGDMVTGRIFHLTTPDLHPLNAQ